MSENKTYSQEVLRKLQLVELETLKELDRICRKHNIKYVIDAGTLLGAVRHKGFIPWDDDVDIRMLRNDYDKFCSIAPKELNANYFLQTYKTDKKYRWGYARILDIRTKFVRKDHEEMNSRNGIFIDIFPCDVYPEGYLSRKKVQMISWICRKGRYSIIGKKHADSVGKKIGFSILSLFPVGIYHKMEEIIIEKYRFTKSEHVRCYAWSEPAEEKGFRKEWFAERKDILFEGFKCYAPNKTPDFLVHSFGEDYMTPPPVGERIPRHEPTMVEFSD